MRRNRQRCSHLLGKQLERFSTADAKPWDLAANDPANPPALPDGVTPRTSRGVDGREPRAAEFGRDDHEGMSRDELPIDILLSAACRMPTHRTSPARAGF